MAERSKGSSSSSSERLKSGSFLGSGAQRKGKGRSR